jgi:hypothetical protein
VSPATDLAHDRRPIRLIWLIKPADSPRTWVQIWVQVEDVGPLPCHGRKPAYFHAARHRRGRDDMATVAGKWAGRTGHTPLYNGSVAAGFLPEVSLLTNSQILKAESDCRLAVSLSSKVGSGEWVSSIALG